MLKSLFQLLTKVELEKEKILFRVIIIYTIEDLK